jgi:hypothetical protein
MGMNTTLNAEIKNRLAVIARVHGKVIADAQGDRAREGGPIPYCDCSRCMLVRIFRDQFDVKGNRK